MSGPTRLQVFSDLRWPESTGIGAVAAEIVSRHPPDIHVVDIQARGSIGSPLGPLSVALALSRRLRDTKAVYWSPGFVPPLWSSFPIVVTVHDLAHLHFYGVMRSVYYDIVFKRLFRKCACIVCVSEFTRSEFISWSGIEPEKVAVVPNAVSRRFLTNRAKADLGFPYILYAGNHRPHKNLDRLVTAYSASSLSKSGIHLVLTGSSNDRLVGLARRHSIAPFVHFLGMVKDSGMPALYRGASATVLISLYEGFGLPIVEGMASETPVIASRCSAMPEVADGAAELVDPMNVSEIAAALDRITNNPALRWELVRRGKKNVSRFDWDRSAKVVWDIVRAVARYSR